MLNLYCSFCVFRQFRNFQIIKCKTSESKIFIIPNFISANLRFFCHQNNSSVKFNVFNYRINILHFTIKYRQVLRFYCGNTNIIIKSVSWQVCNFQLHDCIFGWEEKRIYFGSHNKYVPTKYSVSPSNKYGYK